MCYKSKTYRSSRTDRHKNARPYVRERNLTYNILNFMELGLLSVIDLTQKLLPGNFTIIL